MKPYQAIKKVNPMVYCGLYPIDGSDYENLKNSIRKVKIK